MLSFPSPRSGTGMMAADGCSPSRRSASSVTCAAIAVMFARWRGGTPRDGLFGLGSRTMCKNA